jgi:hypothetical protein
VQQSSSPGMSVTGEQTSKQECEQAEQTRTAMLAGI